MKSKHEMKLISQIIQELSLFVMYHGYQSFDIAFNREDREESFTLVLPRRDMDMLTYLEQKINQKREKEIEAYYGELLGDLDSSKELNILGLVIDYMTVKEEHEHTMITFTRFIKE